MDISTEIHGFLSTLGNYINEEEMQVFKSRTALEEFGFSFVQSEELENLSSYKFFNLDMARTDGLEMLEQFKVSDNGLSPTRGLNFESNLKRNI